MDPGNIEIIVSERSKDHLSDKTSTSPTQSQIRAYFLIVRYCWE